jgi:uncharacterized protein (DUF983 family)
MPQSPAAAGHALKALAGRCPACGDGYLFDGFLKVAPLCEACGFDLASVDTGEGPAVFIILIVGVLAGFGMLIMEVALHPPIWLQMLIWLPTALILCIALLRPLKGAMVASAYLNKAREATRHDL